MPHKERIEALETHMQTLGMEMQQRFDQMADMLRGKKKAKRGRRARSQDSQSSGSSSQSPTENDSDNVEDVSSDDEEEQPKNKYKEKNKPKMTFPSFKGEDPISRLSRARQFFSFQEVKSNERVEYASFFLKGEANQWWQWVRRLYRKKHKSVRWKDFERELVARFGPTGYVDHDEALSRIKQTGDLRSYLKEYERLSMLVHGWQERALLGTFIGGLKPELAKEIKVAKPRTVRKAIELARLEDEHMTDVRRGWRPDQWRTINPVNDSTGIQMRVDLLVLPLSGLDIVLGVQWLSGLGCVASNYKQMTMEFQWGDSWVKFAAATVEGLKAVTSSSLQKICKSGGQCFSIQEVNTVNYSSEQPDVIWPQEIEALLQEFISVIEEPKSIPPKRFFDHKIPLQDEAKPDEIRTRGQTCSYYTALRAKIHESQEAVTDYTERDGIIIHKGRTVVPANQELRQQILHHFHDSVVGGHSGVYRTWLKRRIGNSSIVETQLPVMDQDGDVILQPSRALEYRQMKRGNRVRWEVLIQWDSLPPEESTWEDLSLMKLQFPSLVLEDKDKLKGGRNDEDQGKQNNSSFVDSASSPIKVIKLLSIPLYSLEVWK
ncbi:hypothetical protein MRB53_012066 [Persea americana]|uniref:Uncharacterized protein n=1 Tax=Persea americana TaxID=3435 RepID=A0ACC2LXN0_PERAE|nr:hypothetical protein MRB53_012066 [Persea americana]